MLSLMIIPDLMGKNALPHIRLDIGKWEKILLPVMEAQQRYLTDGRKKTNFTPDRVIEEICLMLNLRLLESGMLYIRDAITGYRSSAIRSRMGQLQEPMMIHRS